MGHSATLLPGHQFMCICFVLHAHDTHCGWTLVLFMRLSATLRLAFIFGYDMDWYDKKILIKPSVIFQNGITHRTKNRGNSYKA